MPPRMRWISGDGSGDPRNRWRRRKLFPSAVWPEKRAFSPVLKVLLNRCKSRRLQPSLTLANVSVSYGWQATRRLSAVALAKADHLNSIVGSAAPDPSTVRGEFFRRILSHRWESRRLHHFFNETNALTLSFLSSPLFLHDSSNALTGALIARWQ